MAADPLIYKIDIAEETDVLVIGSGMAGVCAAIQAGRLGCAVILVEEDKVLGGNSSPNLGIHISGAHSFHPYAGETGIINEIEEEAAYYHAKAQTHTFHYNIAMQWDTLLRRKLAEAGVRVYLRNYGKCAVMDGSRIQSVIVEDLAIYKTRRIDVHTAVIDASGDGQVAYSAGAEFRMGREAKSEFNERGAPEAADHVTMGTSVTALVRKTDRPVKYVPPPGTPPFVVGYGYHRQEVATDCVYSHSCWDPKADFCFLWHTETGGELGTIENEHEICEKLHKHLYAVWHHIKNEAHRKQAECWELVWVSPKAGKRESRRFVGDLILTQNDVETAREFPDAVGYGGYAIDVHDPVGDQVRVIFHAIPPLYGIPYRCLYSRNIENLFLAGRLVSVTHMALGTVRLQKTLATAGEAVGAAAWLCKQNGCRPRDVDAHELQQHLLKNDATIVGVGNEDPDDLARTAKLTATSEAHFECVDFEDFLPLDRTRGVMLWDWGERLDEVEVYLMNQGDTPASLSLNLRFFRRENPWKESSRPVRPAHLGGQSNRMEWGGDCTISRFEPVAVSQATVAPHFAGWVRFRFEGIDLAQKDPASDEERYALTLGPSEGIWWGRRKGFEDFAVACWAGADDEIYTTEPELHLFKIHPRPPYGEAANAVNGVNRRFATNPVNMWISKPGEPLPQALTLDFGEERAFNEVRIAFDTLYRAYREMPFNHEDREVAGMCARDYDVEVWDGNTWRQVVSIQGNYKRFRTHRFDRVRSRKLRLVVNAANDEGWGARVYEVRVYDSDVEGQMAKAEEEAAGEREAQEVVQHVPRRKDVVSRPEVEEVNVFAV